MASPKNIGVQFVNSLQTHCVRGHEFTEENSGHSPHGRYCRTCYNARQRDRYNGIKPRVEREEMVAPNVTQGRVPNPTTLKAIREELRRGADPYKLADYFDVPYQVVFKVGNGIVAANRLLKLLEEKNGNQDTEENQ